MAVRLKAKIENMSMDELEKKVSDIVWKVKN